jgi:hypothetical protein
MAGFGCPPRAETRSQWLVEMTVPRGAIVKTSSTGEHMLNRTEFHRALKETFREWIARLRAGDATLRLNMRRRMNEIVQRHYTS